jgi:hypothetical protein
MKFVTVVLLAEVIPMNKPQHTPTCNHCKHSKATHRNGGCIACPCDALYFEKVSQSHTPTPWYVEMTNAGEIGAKTEVRVFGPDRKASGSLFKLNRIGTGHQDCVARELSELKANAAFIVRAVNAHEDLLKFMKDLNYAFYVKGTRAAMIEVMFKSKALIAKAEGK